MIYTKKLLIAKILVSTGLCLFVLIPLILGFSSGHMAGYYGHLLALPILLWAIWDKKLHGTGRSVRLMAYLGLALTMGSYIAARSNLKLGEKSHESVHTNMILGMDSYVMFAGLVFILLVLGIFISIRRGSDA